jgi:alpha-tubulin suppressor-like RCC1 family protein
VGTETGRQEISPVQVEMPEPDAKILDFACGSTHTVAAANNGEILMWGGSAGDSVRRFTHPKVGSLTHLAAGEHFSAVVDGLFDCLIVVLF